MKFLIDADCPRSIGIMLREAGHTVKDIRDLAPDCPDDEIFQIIQKDSLILITRFAWLFDRCKENALSYS